MCAESRNWKGVNDVSKSIKPTGARKEPGSSAMEVGSSVHDFFVGSKSHPRYREIELMLQVTSKRLRLAGYASNTIEMMLDIEEEEKEDARRWHLG